MLAILYIEIVNLVIILMVVFAGIKQISDPRFSILEYYEKRPRLMSYTIGILLVDLIAFTIYSASLF